MDVPKKTPGELFRCHARTKSDVPNTCPLSNKDESNHKLTDITKLNINAIPPSNINKFPIKKIAEKIVLEIEDESKVILPRKSTQKLAIWHKRCGSDYIQNSHQTIKKSELKHKQPAKVNKPFHRKHISDTTFFLNKENSGGKNNKLNDSKKGLIKVTKGYFINIKPTQKKSFKIPKEAATLLPYIAKCKFY